MPDLQTGFGLRGFDALLCGFIVVALRALRACHEFPLLAVRIVKPNDHLAFAASSGLANGRVGCRAVEQSRRLRGGRSCVEVLRVREGHRRGAGPGCVREQSAKRGDAERWPSTHIWWSRRCCHWAGPSALSCCQGSVSGKTFCAPASQSLNSRAGVPDCHSKLLARLHPPKEGAQVAGVGVKVAEVLLLVHLLPSRQCCLWLWPRSDKGDSSPPLSGDPRSVWAG